MQQIIDKKSEPNDIFERFYFYAPYIESLEAYANSNGYKVLGWPILTAELQARSRPFLPRLQTLEFSNNLYPTHGDEEVMWITTIANETTLRVHMLPARWSIHQWIPYDTTSRLLHVLADRSPNIQELSMYPDDDRMPLGDSDPQETPASSQPWYSYLPRLEGLRHLSVTDGWLYGPCLMILSWLPKLETLEFYPGSLKDFSIIFDIDFDLHLGWFSSLRRISMQGLSPLGVIEVFGICEMFQQITELEIDMGLELLDDGEWRDHWITHDFLPLLANAPQLKFLTIEIRTLRGLKHPIGVPEVLDVMAQLPLETVHLGGMHLGTGALEIDLSSVWPSVTKLSMPSQYASLQELSYFAAMPKLEHLTVALDLTTMYAPENLAITKHAPLSKFASKRNRKILPDYKVMEHNAK